MEYYPRDTSEDELIDALEKAVSDGSYTQEQADEYLQAYREKQINKCSDRD